MHVQYGRILFGVCTTALLMWWMGLPAAAQCPDPSDPRPTAPVGVAIWRPGSGTADVVHALHDTRALYRKIAEREDAGFHVVDLEVAVVDGTARYSVVFAGGATPQWVAVDQTAAGMRLLDAQMAHKGYRPVDLDVYTLDGTVHYAAVWLQDPTLQGFMELDLTPIRLQRRDAAYAAMGFGMSDLVARTDAAGGGLYSAIWAPGGAGRTYDTGRPLAAFKTLIADNLAAGLRLVDIDSRTVDGEASYLSIWEPGAETLALQIGSCIHNVRDFEKAAGNGYVMVDFELVHEGTAVLSTQGTACAGGVPAAGGPDAFTTYYCPDFLFTLVEEPACQPGVSPDCTTFP